jgi:hypothetical protein
MNTNGPLRAILTAGVVCGTLDGLSAIAVSAYFGGAPIRVFQGIAVGVLGRSAFQGGAGAALLGVALHFVIATGAAAVYYFASRSLPVLIERSLFCGIAFGALVDLFMTFVVIPMSAIGRRPFVPRTFVILLVVSMIVVGPSISLTLRRFSVLRRDTLRSIPG